VAAFSSGYLRAGRFVSLYASTTFDGNYAVGSMSGGLTFIHKGPTLLNGAQLADGGTLGTNLFLN